MGWRWLRRAFGGRRVVPAALAALGSVLAPVPGPGVGSEAVAAEDAPVIGRVVTRNYSITVKGGRQGPLYTVRAKTGELLALDASEAELAARNADLWERVRALLAASPDRGVLEWAGE